MSKVTVKDVPVGHVFRTRGGMSDSEFIRLDSSFRNAINTATWQVAEIADDREVEPCGDLRAVVLRGLLADEKLLKEMRRYCFAEEFDIFREVALSIVEHLYGASQE